MAELNSFKECRAYLDKGKNRKNTMDRPIANNTRVIQTSDDRIGIKLHNTFIVKYFDNTHLDCINYGDLIQFDTGGWKTVTTKDRMNRFCPIDIWSERHVWYISIGNWTDKNRKVYHFEDNMFFKPSDNKFYRKEQGQLVELKPFSKAKEKAKRKQLKSIDTFIKVYIEKLASGKLKYPDLGDCFYCQGESNPEIAKKMFIGELDSSGQLVTKQGIDSDHLLSHIKEKYYVSSIVWSAIRSQCYDPTGMFGNPNMTGGLAPIDKHNLSCWCNPDSENKPFSESMTTDRVKKIMKKYFINRLSL
jgi:hypothetical protein